MGRTAGAAMSSVRNERDGAEGSPHHLLGTCCVVRSARFSSVVSVPSLVHSSLHLPLPPHVCIPRVGIADKERTGFGRWRFCGGGRW